MIGKIYGKVFKSKFGEKVLHIDDSGEKVKWDEKGLRRTYFWHMFGFLLFIKFILPVGFSFTSVIISLIVSFYLTEKTVKYIIPILEESESVEFESRDFKDTETFRILKRVFDGEEPTKVIKNEV